MTSRQSGGGGSSSLESDSRRLPLHLQLNTHQPGRRGGRLINGSLAQQQLAYALIISSIFNIHNARLIRDAPPPQTWLVFFQSRGRQQPARVKPEQGRLSGSGSVREELTTTTWGHRCASAAFGQVGSPDERLGGFAFPRRLSCSRFRMSRKGAGAGDLASSAGPEQPAKPAADRRLCWQEPTEPPGLSSLSSQGQGGFFFPATFSSRRLSQPHAHRRFCASSAWDVRTGTRLHF